MLCSGKFLCFCLLLFLICWICMFTDFIGHVSVLIYTASILFTANEMSSLVIACDKFKYNEWKVFLRLNRHRRNAPSIHSINVICAYCVFEMMIVNDLQHFWLIKTVQVSPSSACLQTRPKQSPSLYNGSVTSHKTLCPVITL